LVGEPHSISQHVTRFLYTAQLQLYLGKGKEGGNERKQQDAKAKLDLKKKERIVSLKRFIVIQR
jgi:hypothetical protein